MLFLLLTGRNLVGQRRGMARGSGRGRSYMSNGSEPAQANA